MENATGGHIEVDAIVIGSGFGGCFSLHSLRELGWQAKLLEAGAYFGDVLHWNRYPRARVDSEMPFYQLNIHNVWKNWNWTERFPSHEELRQYFHHVDQTLDLRKDAIFNTNVTSVRYDDRARLWKCKAENGLRAICKYLVVATGSS